MPSVLAGGTMFEISLLPPVFLLNNFLTQIKPYVYIICWAYCPFIIPFLKHYYPNFKEADDLFSIAGFMLIYLVVSALIAVIVFAPYYLFIE